MKLFKKAFRYVSYHGPLKALYYLLRLCSMYVHRITMPGRPVIKKINGMYDMYLDINGKGISQALYLYGTRECDQVAIASEVLKPGMAVLDIGANIGYYALLEAFLVGMSGGRVYAYEPHPDNFSLLTKNIKLNNFETIIKAAQCGISDMDGECEFFISPKSNLHTLNPHVFKPGQKNFFEDSTKVKVLDIARLLKNKEKIDFVRMDIEGHEVEVLGALGRGLDDIGYAPCIMLETHFPKYNDTSHNMKAVLERLLDKGYIIERISSNTEPHNPFRISGFVPEKIIKTDQVRRGIYRNIGRNNALKFICDTGGVRAIFLRRP